MLAFSIVGQVFNFVKRHVRRPSGAAPTQPSRKLTKLRHVGRGWKQNLSGAFLASGTATPRPFLQLADSAVQLPHGWVAVDGVL